MKIILFIVLLLAGGIVYINILIADQTETKSQRFIVAVEKEAANQETLTANLLNNEISVNNTKDTKSLNKNSSEVKSSESTSSLSDNFSANILNDEEKNKETTTSDKVESTTKTTDTNKEVINDILNDIEKGSSNENKTSNTEKEKVVIVPSIMFVKSIPGGDVNTWESGKNLELYFDKDINLDSLLTHLKVSPSDDGSFSGEIKFGKNNKQIILIPIPALKKETKYSFEILNGLKSLDSSVLKEDIKIEFLVK